MRGGEEGRRRRGVCVCVCVYVWSDARLTVGGSRKREREPEEGEGEEGCEREGINICLYTLAFKLIWRDTFMWRKRGRGGAEKGRRCSQ